ncbi:MAG: hypothetical protein U0805_21055 [Pirellulales bacterium]
MKSCTVPHTSLAQARGYGRGIISNERRRNEMLPLSPSQVHASAIERARYKCEIAQMQIATGMYASAVETLREALADGCKLRWLAVANKEHTSITEPERFVEKLRSATFITREEYLLLLRLMARKQPADIFEAEQYAMVVVRIVE